MSGFFIRLLIYVILFFGAQEGAERLLFEVNDWMRVKALKAVRAPWPKLPVIGDNSTLRKNGFKVHRKKEPKLDDAVSDLLNSYKKLRHELKR
ncbi:MAG: hypothetical protein HYS98_09180 [Deltaproteobacteria bacterium]|nr:hypothetical protein [Deltaproteobacteria bacterium]